LRQHIFKAHEHNQSLLLRVKYSGEQFVVVLVLLLADYFEIVKQLILRCAARGSQDFPVVDFDELVSFDEKERSGHANQHHADIEEPPSPAPSLFHRVAKSFPIVGVYLSRLHFKNFKLFRPSS